MRLLLLIVVLGLLAGEARAQPSAAPRLRFQHLTNEDGLSLNLVRAMLQDRRGFMWFGSEDGLNRYDGYRFTLYEAVPFDSTSLLDDDVKALAEDAAGAIWVGSGAGLSRLDPSTGRVRNFYAGDPRGFPPGPVSALAAEPSGAVWVGLSDGGLVRFDPRTGRFRHVRHDPRDAASLSSDVVRALHRDADGALWVGTANGLNRLAPGAGGVFRRYLYD